MSRFANLRLNSALLLTVLILAVASPLSAQTEKSFLPAMQISGADRVGIELINPTLSEQAVGLTARAYDGTMITGSGVTNPAIVTLPPSGKSAFSLTEAFGMGMRGKSGWVELSASTPAVKSAFLVFDANANPLDSESLQGSPAHRLVFPNVSTLGLTPTQVAFANVSGSAVTASINLIDNNGRVAFTRQLQMNAMGGFAGTIRDLVPGAGSFEGYVSVQDGASGAGTLVGVEIDRSASDIALLAALSDSSTLRTGYLAHMATRGGQSSTLILINPSTQSQSVRISALGLDAGNSGSTTPSLTTVKSLPPNGRLEQSVDQLFGFSGENLVTGYIRYEAVTGSAGTMGALQYGKSDGTSLSAIEASGRGRSDFFLAEVRESSTYYSGVAVLNPGSEAATVTIDAFGSSGIRTASVGFNLAAGERSARLLADLFQRPLAGLDGYLRVRANRPVIAHGMLGPRSAVSFLASAPADGARLKSLGNGVNVEASEGGQVASQDGTSWMLIPPDALDSDVVVRIEGTIASRLPRVSATSTALGLFDVTPAGLGLHIPVRIAFPLDEPATPLAELPMLSFDAETGQYAATDFVAIVDASGKLAFADVSYLGTFVVTKSSNAPPATDASRTAAPLLTDNSGTKTLAPIQALAAAAVTDVAPSKPKGYGFNEGTGTTTVSTSGDVMTLNNTRWTSGKFGQAISVTGSNSYAEAADATLAALGTTATFEAWIYLKRTPTDIASILNKWSQTVDDEYLLGLNNNRTLLFAWHTTGSYAWGTPGFDSVSSSRQIPLNSWTHIAVVRDGTSLTLLINGVPDKSGNYMDTNPFRKGTNSLRIGGQKRGSLNRYINANIDEVRIYDRALSPSEVQADMLAAVDNTAAGQNQAPTVSAGANQAITLPATATLNGTASDDGLPTGSTLATAWSKLSGPGTVLFANAAELATTATFSSSGSYVLRLTATDGSLLSTGDVTVTVNELSPGNLPPTVSAGLGQTITMPAAATLGGTASDDGLPIGSALTTTWSKVSGPGTVTFANANQLATTATFSASGAYLLRLTAFDGALSVAADVTVTVDAPPVPAPTIASLSPASSNPGTTLAAVVSGSGLTGATSVTFSGTGVTATIASGGTATSLPITVTIASSAIAGTRTLTLTTPGGTATKVSSFTVNTPPPPAPAVSGLTTSSGTQGTSISTTLTGTNLTGTSSVTFSGSGVTASIGSGGSATSLPVTVTIASSAATGVRSVTVSTPGGTATAAAAFTVNAAALTPVITGVSPGSANQGTTMTMTVSGSNLAGASSFMFSGSGVSATVGATSASSVSLSVSVSSSAAIGPRSATITTPSGTFTLASAFSVNAPPTSGGCTVTLSSGASISSALSSVTSGGTVCLNAGSYPAYNSSISKSSLTRVKPADGVSQSQVTVASVNFNTSQYISFEGMTIGGGQIGTTSAPAMHTRLIGNRFTSSLCILTPTNVNQDTLVDGNSFINVGQGCSEGRIGVRGNNSSYSVPNGVVISNNLFQGSGPSDGVQLIGGAYGTVIGPGNEFVGIKQSGCGSVHCDPIQIYGARRTTITGNYFHGNSTGLMFPDNTGQVTITHNVFVTDGEYPNQIVIGGGSGDVISHNTFANGANIRVGSVNVNPSSGETITNNIVSGGFFFSEGQSTSGFTIDYNLVPGGGGGSHSISGSATYVGGSKPTTWAGYSLAASSPGNNAASDGTDMGASIP